MIICQGLKNTVTIACSVLLYKKQKNTSGNCLRCFAGQYSDLNFTALS